MMRRPVMRRRGVGLVGTMAVGGLAYAAGSSAAKGQAREQGQEQRLMELEAQQAYAAPPPQAAPPPPAAPPPASTNVVEQLQQLADLKERGILTEAEFEAQKARILSG